MCSSVSNVTVVYGLAEADALDAHRFQDIAMQIAQEIARDGVLEVGQCREHPFQQTKMYFGCKVVLDIRRLKPESQHIQLIVLVIGGDGLDFGANCGLTRVRFHDGHNVGQNGFGDLATTSVK